MESHAQRATNAQDRWKSMLRVIKRAYIWFTMNISQGIMSHLRWVLLSLKDLTWSRRQTFQRRWTFNSTYFNKPSKTSEASVSYHKNQNLVWNKMEQTEMSKNIEDIPWNHLGEGPLGSKKKYRILSVYCGPLANFHTKDKLYGNFNGGFVVNKCFDFMIMKLIWIYMLIWTELNWRWFELNYNKNMLYKYTIQ
jgi:hypothetical protein